ncbi:MAG TPA: hypothetical protein VGO11_03735, partial [Chthoniobacteraceae bacterium]|nr:hypothetical protein [Chthoniobacteraceae bacterium]
MCNDFAPAAFLTPSVSTKRPNRRSEAGRIELLEQRVTPAAIVTHWVGSSGNWTDPAHWDHGVPDNADGNSYTAIVDTGTVDPVVTIDSHIRVSSLTNAETIQLDGAGSAQVGDPVYGAGSLDNSAGSISIGGSAVFTVSGEIAGLTTAKLGNLHVAGGTFALKAALTNTGAVLSIDAPAGAWDLQGGSIVGGTVNATVGSKLQATAGGVLDGVTMNADLEPTSNVLVKNGLILNGTATVGADGRFTFQETQTLNGTGSIFLTENSNNGVFVAGTAPTLTIGSGMTIHGGTQLANGGYIGTVDSTLDSTIVNNGKIAADDAKRLYVSGSKLVNHGALEANDAYLEVGNLSTSSGTITALNNSAIALSGDHWTNTGTISLSVSNLYLYHGTVTTAGLGVVTASNAKIFVDATLDNTGATLSIDSAGWVLEGGTILGGTVQSTHSAALLTTFNRGVLAGVTLNADLDATAGFQNVGVDIQGGLTLNGTATLGELGLLRFAGTQTLGGTGTVVFNDSPHNALVQTGAAPVLTIGSGMTIQGGNGFDGGFIGYSFQYGGAMDGTIINEGKISTSVFGRGLNLNATVVNHGTMETSNGAFLQFTRFSTNSGTLSASNGSLLLITGNNWTNTGTLTVSNAELVLEGSVTTAGLGARSFSGAGVHLRGTVDNTGATLTLDPGATWFLEGGTIKRGIVQSSGGSKLTASQARGSLVGVTLNADLDLTGALFGIFNNGVDIQGGLTLNGTATLGEGAELAFGGTQTLDGTGTVVFNDTTGSALVQVDAAPVLTIGSGITIRGGSSQLVGGEIGYDAAYGSALDGTIINEGTISADVAGASLTLNAGSFVNHGTIEAKNGGTAIITHLTNSSGTLRALQNGVLEIGGQHWTNTGTLSETNGTLFLDGTFTTAGLGTPALSGGFVTIRGTLVNT